MFNNSFFEKYADSLAAYFEQATGIWVLYQIAAVVFAICVAWAFSSSISRQINNFIDQESGHWLADWKREIIERIAPAILLSVLWIELLVFRQLTWTSNTVLLGTFAKLTTAWIIINLLASVIRNKFLFRVVSITLWIIAALSILRLLPAVTDWLDAKTLPFGETPISLLRGLQAVALLIALIWGVGFLSRLAEKGLKRSADLSSSMQVLLAKLIRIILVIIAVVTALNAVGIDLTAFAVFSGAIGVGIGFGLQKTVSNFISGISLLLDRSIKPGDVISLGDSFGWISQLNTRYTSVVTSDGKEHLIPNENMITNEVINWSHSNNKVRIEIPFGVSYEANPHDVKKTVEAHCAKHSRILQSPKCAVHFDAFGDSSLNFFFRFWISEPSDGLVNIKSEILFDIWDALKAAGIEIPYPKRDLYAPNGIRVHVENGK
jgi:small-conductance mechanosensitive channel